MFSYLGRIKFVSPHLGSREKMDLNWVLCML